MIRNKLNRQVLTALTAVITIMVLAVGCSQNPVISEPDQTQVQVLKRSVDFVSKVTEGGYYAEAIISAKDGGQLTLFDVTLDIPAGAVANDTVFSINIPDITTFYNEFGTDGLVFNQPVKVTMSYRDADLSNIDETTIRIAWFNEATDHYEDMLCTIDKENKVVVGELNHFSAYALISDYVGGLPPR